MIYDTNECDYNCPGCNGCYGCSGTSGCKGTSAQNQYLTSVKQVCDESTHHSLFLLNDGTIKECVINNTNGYIQLRDELDMGLDKREKERRIKQAALIIAKDRNDSDWEKFVKINQKTNSENKRMERNKKENDIINTLFKALSEESYSRRMTIKNVKFNTSDKIYLMMDIQFYECNEKTITISMGITYKYVLNHQLYIENIIDGLNEKFNNELVNDMSVELNKPDSNNNKIKYTKKQILDSILSLIFAIGWMFLIAIIILALFKYTSEWLMILAGIVVIALICSFYGE